MTAAVTLGISDYRLGYRTEAGPLQVLDGVDLSINQGEVLGLVGESGSGKSTLAYAVMRALQAPVVAQSGVIELAGTALTAMTEDEIAALRGNRIAMVFQDPGASLNPTMTLGEHFEQVLRRHRRLGRAEAREETRRLVEMVGLPDPDLMAGKYPHEVSGGEKQRAVIALAFACDPELILFDEPTSALDATTAANILDLFRELQARTGVSALFISHDLGTVGEIAHRVAVIYAGRIVEIAARDALFREPRHPYTRALLASLPRPTAVDHEQALLPFLAHCPIGSGQRRVVTSPRAAPSPRRHVGPSHSP
ncbi:MAG: ABC transporter ATP-binding protein [Alphaproteobacteria bacterium]|nr:ABC transporter ATP-binding protein [Alphaproteobacteria bacterium]